MHTSRPFRREPRALYADDDRVQLRRRAGRRNPRLRLLALPRARAAVAVVMLIDWLCVLAFLALIVEVFIGALNLIDRLR